MSPAAVPSIWLAAEAATAEDEFCVCRKVSSAEIFVRTDKLRDPRGYGMRDTSYPTYAAGRDGRVQALRGAG